MNVDETLVQRGKTYGDFAHHAGVASNIKRAMQDSPNWGQMPDVHHQALAVIADKIARVLTGDPRYADNAHDLGGYAQLVENYINSGGVSCLPPSHG